MNAPKTGESQIEVRDSDWRCGSCSAIRAYGVRIGPADNCTYIRVCVDCAGEIYEDVMAADANLLRSREASE